MQLTSNQENSHVISYLTLRQIVGVLGISFPFILAGGNMIIQGAIGIQPSISAYYHTPMGDVFVGTLCVIGFVLQRLRAG